MATPAFLVRLMAHKGLSRGFRLGPEDREAYVFANGLRVAAIEGRLHAVFTHPANELAWRGKATPAIALARALGLITGASDYLFLAANRSLALEFKSHDGRLTTGQKDWRSWCDSQGVPFRVARSSAEGMDILREEGLLT